MDRTLIPLRGKRPEESCGPGRRGQAGFTLVEVLIANLLGLILIAALTACFTALSNASRNQIEHHRLILAADAARRTLMASFRQAGQNRTGSYLTTPAASEIWIDSDLTGNAGDPDGGLAHSFERTRYRMTPEAAPSSVGADFDRTGNLQWKSGAGSFQPFISHVGTATFSVQSAGGEPVAVQSRLTTRGAFYAGGGGQIPSRSLQFDFPIDRTREQWFRYDLPPP